MPLGPKTSLRSNYQLRIQPINFHSLIGEPLRSIDSSCGDASVSRTDHPSTQPDASPSTASHSGDDTKALKEAVENIQKLFSIHLLQQENGDNEDSTDEDGEQPNQSGGSG